MPHPIPSDLRAVAVFAGGIGLGAYQAGAYAAIHDNGLRPDWIAASSIGGVNAAIIAGNAPAQRVEKLQALWSTGDPWLHAPAARGADSAAPWRAEGMTVSPGQRSGAAIRSAPASPASGRASD